MKTTNDYLDEILELENLKSDYQLAKRLKISGATISRYRSNQSSPDNYVAVKMANILNISPMEIVAVATAEKTKKEDELKFWKNFYKKVSGHAAVWIVTASAALLSSPFIANSIYYVK